MRAVSSLTFRRRSSSLSCGTGAVGGRWAVGVEGVAAAAAVAVAAGGWPLAFRSSSSLFFSSSAHLKRKYNLLKLTSMWFN
jgi:hypothetical protein